MTNDLQSMARECAGRLTDPDRKQLRFNDIVSAALKFYVDPEAGVRELVESCGKDSPLYVKKAPMWATLETQYAWMVVA